MRGIARQIAYSVIDFASNRRRAQEWTAARTRWEAAKVVFAAERRVEGPMTYREFALAGAAAGDRASERVASQLLGVVAEKRQVLSRDEPASAPAHRRDDLMRSPESMPIAELRSRLAQIGKDASGRYEEANARRQGLERIDRPPTLEEVLAAERAAIRAKITKETDLNDMERRRLTELRTRQRSWNPVARSVAKAEEQQVLEAREQRFGAALRTAHEQFENDRVPDIQRGRGALERRYKEYVRASLGYESEMRDARETLRQALPRIFDQLEVLERAGVASLEAVPPKTGLMAIANAVSDSHRSLPPATVAAIERDLRRERNRDRERAFDRGR
jgi:hypothetical protein